MKTRTKAVVMPAVVIMAMMSAGAAPATHPASSAPMTRAAEPPRESSDFRARPLPQEYAPLLTHSIFVKGRQRTPSSDTPRTPVATSISTPQQRLVFSGITIVDGRPQAFVEDTATGNVSALKDGDAIAGGIVQNITFDGFDYVVADNVTHVAIGQNLTGAAASVGNTPTAGASPSTTSGAGGTDDILKRLRERRLQESGGK